jgi:hypothetical protein
MSSQLTSLLIDVLLDHFIRPHSEAYGEKVLVHPLAWPVALFAERIAKARTVHTWLSERGKLGAGAVKAGHK